MSEILCTAESRKMNILEDLVNDKAMELFKAENGNAQSPMPIFSRKAKAIQEMASHCRCP
jgi:hypothetical protein